MAALNVSVREVLFARGIAVSDTSYGTEITFNSIGLSWILNYVNSFRNLGVFLSLKLLKEISRFERDDNSWRELRFQATRLPVYDTAYWQLVFYLEGSPPKAVFSFPPDYSSISTKIDIPLSAGSAFRIKNDQIVRVIFSESEVDSLGRGETVCLNSAFE